MRDNRCNKSISFNIKDAYEKKLLDYALLDKHGDFSKYVKRLIAFDMEGHRFAAVNPAMVAIPMEQEDDIDAMMACI